MARPSTVATDEEFKDNISFLKHMIVEVRKAEAFVQTFVADPVLAPFRMYMEQSTACPVSNVGKSNTRTPHEDKTAAEVMDAKASASAPETFHHASAQLRALTPLLDAFLQETQRLHVPLPGGCRGLDPDQRETVTVQGYEIPQGAKVLCVGS